MAWEKAIPPKLMRLAVTRRKTGYQDKVKETDLNWWRKRRKRGEGEGEERGKGTNAIGDALPFLAASWNGWEMNKPGEVCLTDMVSRNVEAILNDK